MEHNVSKKIIGIVILVALVLSALVYIFVQSSRLVIDNSQVSSTNILQQVMYRVDSYITREMLWNVLQKYSEAAKNQNISELQKYAYQLSSVCQGESISEECISRMNTAYDIASKFNKKDFVVLYRDNMQAILATVPVLSEDEATIGYTKQYLVFVRKESGKFSVAGIDPMRSWFANKSENTTKEDLLADVEAEMLDSDLDGAPDRFERCELPMNLLVTNCDKTDPNVRDSNGDGWWDGIEPFLAPR